MSDILLQKPQAGEIVTLTPLPENRIVFDKDLDPGDALLERDGDNLVLSFDDGASIVLADFYVAYTSENMPEFVIGDAIVPGESFFAALSEDLMPAAGNSSSPQGSGSGVQQEEGTLQEGIEREGRRDQQPEDDDNSGDDNDFGNNNNNGTGGDGGAGAGAGGDTPVNYVPEMVNGPKTLTTDDSFLANGTLSHKSAHATDHGQMTFNSADTMNGGTITIGSEVVNVTQDPEGSFILSKTLFDGDYGYLTVNSLTQNADGSYTLDYKYTQDTAYDHNLADSSKAKDVEGFTIKIQDGSENAGSELGLETAIKINIKDDGVILKNTEVETNFFTGGADSEALKTASEGDGVANKTWSWNQYKGEFHNAADDAAIITLGTGDNAFTITGALIQDDGSYHSNNVTLGWRVDNAEVDIEYADGLGMISSVSNDSHYEVGGSSHLGTEALIIDLPKDAYGIDLSFGCLFTKNVNSVDVNDEVVTLEFYKGDTLVYTVEKVTGVADGNENFVASVISDESFDQVRIIPNGSNSDFVLTGVSFPELSRSGELEVVGADLTPVAVEHIALDSVTVDGETFTKVKEGESLTLKDGTVLTLTAGTIAGEFVAVAANGDSYFSVVLDGNQWTINEYQKFDGEIDITFAVQDPDGKNYTLGLGGTGDDTMNGDGSKDQLYGGEGDDNLNGGAGNDNLNGGAGDDNLNGGKGDDNLNGGAGDDTLNGGKGDDNLNGGKGDDDLDGGKGHDTLVGGKGDDNLDGEKGNDIIIGKAGNDTLDGGIGNDELLGNDGDDILFGGSGNDYIVGGNGADELYGEAGDDLIVMDMNDVFVDGGEGMDVLLVGAEDLAGVKSMLQAENSDITDMEVVIAGDVKGKSTEEVFSELGLSTNEDGNIKVADSWGEGTVSGNFTEFTNQDDSVTILVETIKLETGTA